MLNNKFHTHLPLKIHRNGGEGIHFDSYKESHLDSHQGDLVSDNVTKVTPTATHLYSLYSAKGITHVRESIKSIDILH